MSWVDLAADLFGGLFLSNALPHFLSGVMGRSFQSPFASPPGRGLSSAMVNVVWGAFNLVVAWLLLVRVGRFDLRVASDAAAFGAGLFGGGVMLARSFAPLHGGRAGT